MITAIATHYAGHPGKQCMKGITSKPPSPGEVYPHQRQRRKRPPATTTTTTATTPAIRQTTFPNPPASLIEKSGTPTPCRPDAKGPGFGASLDRLTPICCSSTLRALLYATFCFARSGRHELHRSLIGRSNLQRRGRPRKAPSVHRTADLAHRPGDTTVVRDALKAVAEKAIAWEHLGPEERYPRHRQRPG